MMNNDPFLLSLFGAIMGYFYNGCFTRKFHFYTRIVVSTAIVWNIIIIMMIGQQQQLQQQQYFVSALNMPPSKNFHSGKNQQQKQQLLSLLSENIQKRKINAEMACSACTNNKNDGPIFSQGLDTYRVPMALHELNRARLTQAMLQQQALGEYNNDDTSTSSSYLDGIILLQGGKQMTRYDTDHEPVFRQESYFHWAFGISEADVYGTISLPSGDATIFVPQYGIDYEIFCGSSPKLEEIQLKYGVENVLPLSELPNFISSQLNSNGNGNSNGNAAADSSISDKNNNNDTNDESTTSNENNNNNNKSNNNNNPQHEPQLHLLSGLNTDSGNMAMPAYYDGIQQHSSKFNTDLLFTAMANARVYKTLAEIELLRYTHWVSSMAHVEVMRYCKVGMMEYQLESLFQHYTYTHGGARHMSYTCICACGPNPAILHYGHAGRPNNRQLCDGDMALLDMGAEYHCYASDITCSFPVNGQFTKDQLIIYNAVLAAQVNVIKAMRPGVAWTEMHRTAERAILKGLVKGGILVGGNANNDENDDNIIEEMIQADLGAIFMPHGLGHLIGLDTHDVGGYLPGGGGGNTPPRSDRPGLRKLRTARILEEHMVLTVEPGCYFIDILLDLALANPAQAKFIDAKRLNDFRGTGGVRLEDGVLVTKDGCENLTICPRAVSEIYDVMNGGGQWPPKYDVMPELRRNWITNDRGTMVRLDIPTMAS